MIILNFFHEWDNSAFKKRGHKCRLSRNSLICVQRIYPCEKLEIVFSVKTNEISKEKEEQISISYHNYYNSLIRLEKRKTKRYIKFSVILLLISIILLFTYGLLINRDNTIISKVFLESLLIGGWVFTWGSYPSTFYRYH